jgi:hypothetical protein
MLLQDIQFQSCRFQSVLAFDKLEKVPVHFIYCLKVFFIIPKMMALSL